MGDPLISVYSGDIRDYVVYYNKESNVVGFISARKGQSANVATDRCRRSDRDCPLAPRDRTGDRVGGGHALLAYCLVKLLYSEVVMCARRLCRNPSVTRPCFQGGDNAA